MYVCRYFYLYSVVVLASYHFRVVSIFILAINHQMNYFMAASPAQPWSWWAGNVFTESQGEVEQSAAQQQPFPRHYNHYLHSTDNLAI